MNRPLSAENAAPILVRLLEAMIANPRKLVLEADEKTGLVTWLAQVDISDAGAILGQRGSHIHALSVVFSVIGRRNGEDWRFAMKEPEPGERVWREPKRALNHSPMPDKFLLEDLIGVLLDQPADVVLTDPTPTDFIFTVQPSVIQDYERLVTAVPATRAITLTPIAALGTIFRAIGRLQGVGYSVSTPGKISAGPERNSVLRPPSEN